MRIQEEAVDLRKEEKEQIFIYMCWKNKFLRSTIYYTF